MMIWISVKWKMHACMYVSRCSNKETSPTKTSKTERDSRKTDIPPRSGRGTGMDLRGRPNAKTSNVEFPLNAFRKRSDKLSRTKGSFLTQFWTDHVPHNTHFHGIKAKNSASRQKCDLGTAETSRHFLFECVAYSGPRCELYRKIWTNKRPWRRLELGKNRTKNPDEKRQSLYFTT